MERIIIILFILCNSYLSAQKIPQFLTKIKFEDAIGNSKVIEVGYDLSIDPCLPNHPEFGEVLKVFSMLELLIFGILLVEVVVDSLVLTFCQKELLEAVKES
jgi:hypothetical protein